MQLSDAPPQQGARRAPSAFTPATQARRTGWVADPSTLTCPKGHVMRETGGRLREDGTWRCLHLEPGQRQICGALVFLVAIPAFGRRHRLWAADVIFQELTYFEAQQWGVDEIFAYLGAAFPRGERAR